MYVLTDLRRNAEENNVPVLALLDLCSTVRTVEHSSLLLDEKKWFRQSENGLKWFYFYLLCGKFFATLGDYLSKQ